ncbi:MAG: AbgT family transporter, partial [Planctomycetota bacterium]
MDDPKPENQSDAGERVPSGAFAKFLAAVEWLGNLLPHPVTLFALFALGVVVLSGIAAAFGLAVEDPRPGAEGAMLTVRSLVNGDGVRWMSQSLVTNFTGFVPLGTVLVALLGVGVAERSGLLTTAVRALVLSAPKNLVTAVIVFAGVISNTASEMGYVVLIPLAMAIYYSLGRHPLAGMAAAFAGVSGGYSANLLIGTVDPLLAGITEEAARILDPAYEVHPAVNWYFMIASTFFITAAGWFVSAKIVEPRLGKYDPSQASEDVGAQTGMEPVTRLEIKGLIYAALSCLAVVAGIVIVAGPFQPAGWLPGWGVLRNPDPTVTGPESFRPLLRSV